MPTPTAAPRYNSPMEQLAEGHKPLALLPLNLAGLLGTWENVDPATRGIVRVVLTEQQGKPHIHVYGACHPTACDWKEVTGLTYDASVSGGAPIAFTTTYNFDFKDTILVGHLEDGKLMIEDFNTFKDGSGRAPYYDKGMFKRAAH